MNPAQASKSRCILDKRKSFTRVEKPKHKRKVYTRSVCQYPGCFATPKRMYNHLRETHKLQVNTSKFQLLLREAVPVLSDPIEILNHVEMVTDSNKDVTDFVAESMEQQKQNKKDEEILRAINTEAKEAGLEEKDIDDSEAEEDFVMSEDSETGHDEDKLCEINEETDKILKSFSEWLETVDGGEKKVGDAIQNANRVRTILKMVDADAQNIQSLMDGPKVRDLWFMKFKKSSRRPGTIRAYCNSLRLLTEFLEITKWPGFRLKDIRSIQTQARTWSKSLNRPTKIREHEKNYEDFDLLFNPQDLMNFDSSRPCREAIAVLEKFSLPEVGIVPKMLEYTSVRDFLLWNLAVDNGGRPGPFIDMTISQFLKARKHVENEAETNEIVSYVVPIFHHKTDVHGPAQVVFTSALYKWCEIFLNNIRGRFYGLPKGHESPFFVANNGNKMASGNISGRMTALWNKGNFDGKKSRMNNTLVRKSLTTHVHTHHHEKRGILADKLLHKLATAERFYNVARKSENAVSTVREIRAIFGRDGTTVNNDNVAIVEEQGANIAAKEKKLSDVENELIVKHFRHIISSGEVSMTEVRGIIESQSDLECLHGKVKQVVDKIRYLKKKSPSASIEVDTLPEESFGSKMNRNGYVSKVYICISYYVLGSN